MQLYNSHSFPRGQHQFFALTLRRKDLPGRRRNERTCGEFLPGFHSKI